MINNNNNSKNSHPRATSEQESNDTTTRSTCSSSNCTDNKGVYYYYFAYGPMVHPLVRHRRGIPVADEQPAILRDHRLTFAMGVGGAASVIPQRGYDVHGMVMKCRTVQDWERLQRCESGYVVQEKEVYPYRETPKELPVFSLEEDSETENINDNDNRHDEEQVLPIRAKVFVLQEGDPSDESDNQENSLLLPVTVEERLPQERYLRLIAAGLTKYNIDQDYIQDQIWGIPFNPSRKPQDYSEFPVLHLPESPLSSSSTRTSTNTHLYHGSHKSAFLYAKEETDTDTDSDAPLPKITWEGYQQLCSDMQEAAKAQPGGGHPPHLFFVVGRHVILVREYGHDVRVNHPGAAWLQANAFGQKDVTSYLYQTHVDLDLPQCDDSDDMTNTYKAKNANVNVVMTPAQLQAWAENLLVHSMAQGLKAYRVLELVHVPETYNNKEEVGDDPSLVQEESDRSVERMRAFLTPPKRRRSTLKRLTHRIRQELVRGRRRRHSSLN